MSSLVQACIRVLQRMVLACRVTVGSRSGISCGRLCPWGQVTAFVALLALDTRRIARRQLELAPCVHAPASWFAGKHPAPAAAGETAAAAPTADVGVALEDVDAPALTNGDGAAHAGARWPLLRGLCLSYADTIG